MCAHTSYQLAEVRIYGSILIQPSVRPITQKPSEAKRSMHLRPQACQEHGSKYVKSYDDAYSAVGTLCQGP